MRATLSSLAAAAALAAPLTGCALLDGLAERAGTLVHDYCREALDVRQGIRAKANQYAAPHVIRVSCAGDPT